MSFRPYNVPPTAPTRPPIAAPVPAPLPPPAIAPPAAPTAAPPHASDGGVLHHPDGLVPLTRRRGCVFVTRVDCALGRDRRCRTWTISSRSRRSGRGLHSCRRVSHLLGGFGPRPVRDDDPSDDRRDDHKSHPDRDQLPRVVPTIVHLDSPC